MTDAKVILPVQYLKFLSMPRYTMLGPHPPMYLHTLVILTYKLLVPIFPLWKKSAVWQMFLIQGPQGHNSNTPASCCLELEAWILSSVQNWICLQPQPRPQGLLRFQDGGWGRGLLCPQPPSWKWSRPWGQGCSSLIPRHSPHNRAFTWSSHMVRKQE